MFIVSFEDLSSAVATEVFHAVVLSAVVALAVPFPPRFYIHAYNNASKSPSSKTKQRKKLSALSS
jgi:hypothetical protein